MRSSIPAILLAVLTALCISPTSKAEDMVATPEAAIAAAKDAWESIHQKTPWSDVYSKSATEKFEPYVATLHDRVWIVRGTFPVGYRGKILETRVSEGDGSVSVKVAFVTSRISEPDASQDRKE